jgi:hypothetical protein
MKPEKLKDSFYASPQTVENIFDRKAKMAKQRAQMQAQLTHLLNNDSSSNAPMPDPVMLEHSKKY